MVVVVVIVMMMMMMMMMTTTKVTVTTTTMTTTMMMMLLTTTTTTTMMMMTMMMMMMMMFSRVIQEFPVDDNCGQRLPVSESRILNGIPSSLCDWPFVVSIRSLKTGFAPPLTFSNTDPSCSGVILNREWVLTHALCCYIQDSTPDQAASNLVVVAGEYNVLQADVDPATGQRAEQLLRVSRCYVHPSYVLDGQDTLDSVDVNNDMQTNSNGLALIRLADPVQQSNCASQACLPSATPLRNTGCDTYNNCVFLGWGYSAADYSVLDPRLSYGRTTIYRDSVCDYMAQSVYPTKPRPEGSACTSPRDGTGVCVVRME
nr:hypothetical protein BaRGS_021891 [Batillaria attramentaria]